MFHSSHSGIDEPRGLIVNVAGNLHMFSVEFKGYSVPFSLAKSTNENVDALV